MDSPDFVAISRNIKATEVKFSALKALFPEYIVELGNPKETHCIPFGIVLKNRNRKLKRTNSHRYVYVDIV